MHGDFALFATITMALLMAFIGGYAARKLGLPPLVGYLVAGMLIGPFTPGFVGDVHDASQLAEMGVIFMMFGVGLHFSLKDLWAVRSIAIPGAVLQMTGGTILGFVITQAWGWSVEASLVLGLALSIASTVVLLRGLVDNGLLNTPQGKVAIGWLVLEDLATVAIVVLLPAVLGESAGNPLENLLVALAKTGIFVAVMLFVGGRLLPWILIRIAHLRSRELFILAVVTIALGTAFGAAQLFGVSLALGAFLAGVVIGESKVSHQVGAEVLPFREIFAVLFFVSVGMLVNPGEIMRNLGHVLLLTAAIVIGKGLITIVLGLVIPASTSTVVLVGVALSQIGEFSFIVGQSGLSLGVLSQEQYSLILAGSLLSIILNPLMFKLRLPLEHFIERIEPLNRMLNRHVVVPESRDHGLTDHVVIVGYGRVGRYISEVLEMLKIPQLIIEQDAARAKEFEERGVPTLFGNAADSELITHAGLTHARALVVTVPDEVTTELIVVAARDITRELPIIVRGATTDGVERLAEFGANAVIHPEMEGGLEIVRHTLLSLGYPTLQIQQYVDEVRRDAYDVALTTHEEHRYFEQLLAASKGMEIAWYRVAENSPVVGQTLAQANLRAKVGASVIAIVHEGKVMANPKSSMEFHSNDIVGLIGDDDELEAVEKLLVPPSLDVPVTPPIPSISPSASSASSAAAT